MLIDEKKGVDAMNASFDPVQLKKMIKAALIEVLEERKDLIQNAIEDSIEDLALAHAIEKGESTELIHRDEVLKIIAHQA